MKASYNIRSEDIESLVKETATLLEKLDHLPPVGTSISLSEAEREYGIGKSTLGRWARQGWIATLKAPVAGGAERLVDEHYLAIAVRLYRALQGGAGKPLMRRIIGPHLKRQPQDTN